jgi:phosphatidate cytidylyltransferase
LLKQRLLLGPVLILLLVGGIWLDSWLDAQPLPGWLSALLPGHPDFPPGVIVFTVVLVLSFIAARELVRILRDKGIQASMRLSCAAAVLGLGVSCLVPSEFRGEHSATIVSSAAAMVLVTSLAFYSRRQTVEGVIAATGGTLLAFVYLGLMFGFVLAIRREHSAWTLLWILVTTKSCDIGAYFTGKAIGRHKLIVWLSPGKTWEGLAGGTLLAAAVGALGVELLRQYGHTALPTWQGGALAGVLFAIVGQVGDLMASLLKRDAGLKDAGKILPGFGGMLDVIDSPLLVAPAAYWLLRVVVHQPLG